MRTQKIHHLPTNQNDKTMKLTPKKIEMCAQWVRENGLTDFGGASVAQFCKANDINKTTFYEWQKKKEFSNAIEKAKEEFAETIERDIVVSLAKVAKGYTYTKTKTEYKDKNGKPVVGKKITEEVEVQPNVGAAIFILTNINPNKWKNKIQNDVNAEIKSENETSLNYDIADIPDDMLFALADKLQSAQFDKIKAEKEGKSNA